MIGGFTAVGEAVSGVEEAELTERVEAATATTLEEEAGSDSC